jgi:hypothetical protein
MLLYRKATLIVEIATLICCELNSISRVEVLVHQRVGDIARKFNLFWSKPTWFVRIARLDWRKSTLASHKALQPCRKTTLRFHESNWVHDENTLFGHNASWFRPQKTLLLPGNMLFRYDHTCFRGRVKSIRTGST